MLWNKAGHCKFYKINPTTTHCEKWNVCLCFSKERNCFGVRGGGVWSPLQISLMLFFWSFHSSFLLYLSSASLIITFSTPWIIVTCSPLPALMFLCYPRLVFWITMDSLSLDCGVHTDDLAVCDALSKPINVLSMQITECLPFCHLKTALKCL